MNSKKFCKNSQSAAPRSGAWRGGEAVLAGESGVKHFNNDLESSFLVYRTLSPTSSPGITEVGQGTYLMKRLTN